MPVLEKEQFAVEAIPGRDENGDDMLVLIAKRTYRLDPVAGVCTLEGIDAQPPIHGDDKYDDTEDMLAAEMIEDGEMAPYKPKTDVIVRGKAYAPNGVPVPEFEVSFQVGPLRKRLRILGPRRATWQPPQKETDKELVPRPPLISEPKPIAKLPLSWKNAWGGWSPLVPWLPPKMREGKPEESAGTVPCPFNTIGKGFAIGHSRLAIDGLELPGIEDPDRPILPEQLGRDPARLMEWDIVPAGCGPVSKGSWMRACFAGFDPVAKKEAQVRIDEMVVGMDPNKPDDVPTIRSLLEYQPPDLDGRFYNAAPLDQQVDSLKGDETVRLVNLDKNGKTAFNLPGKAPIVTLDRGRGLEAVAPRLDTLVIDREAERVTLVWRGRLRMASLDEMATYPNFDLKVREVQVGLEDRELRKITDEQGWGAPSAPTPRPEPDLAAEKAAREKAREIAKKKEILKKKVGLA
jgi:hypothetical protein